jgi:hypothetical protein
MAARQKSPRAALKIINFIANSCIEWAFSGGEP